MHLMFRTTSCLFLMAVAPAFGQGPTLVATGYSDPSLMRVAPGQITTLFVAGLKTVLSEPVKASSLPLPTMLAGISIALGQNGQAPLPIPLLSVRQLLVCENSTLPPSSGLTSDCVITAITVQIPFKLLLPPQGVTAELFVNENGNVSKGFKVLPVSANLHVLKGCDAFPSERLEACDTIVTHSDGVPVTSNAPAKAGETVVVYAFGLGQTTPIVMTGDATPDAAASLASTKVAVQFDFRPNAMPSNPYVNPNTAITEPSFAGLTPEQVGLYQINVKIPDVVPPVVPCSLSLGVQSNLTIDIGSTTSGGISFDGAPICVQSPQ